MQDQRYALILALHTVSVVSKSTLNGTPHGQGVEVEPADLGVQLVFRRDDKVSDT